MNKERNRIQWVDIAKGFAILFVIIGHTACYGTTGPIIKKIIYSFHMPLFFIMSGFTSEIPATFNELVSKTKKLATSLLIPAYSAYICKEIIYIIINQTNIDLNYILRQLYTLLFINSGDVNYQEIVTFNFGCTWFLVILFLCRTIFNYIVFVFDHKQLFPLTFILSLLGFAIEIQNIHTPFAFDIALTILPFILFGYYLKNWDFSKYKFYYMILTILAWITSSIIICPHLKGNVYLHIIRRNFPLYPLCFLTAVSGSLFLFYVCIIVSKFKFINIIALIGKHSIILFWFITLIFYGNRFGLYRLINIFKLYYE